MLEFANVSHLGCVSRVVYRVWRQLFLKLSPQLIFLIFSLKESLRGDLMSQRRLKLQGRRLLKIF